MLEKQFVTPAFPLPVVLGLIAIVLAELVIYGILIAIPALWITLAFGGFYLTFTALFRKDALPLVFSMLFLTAHHSLLLNYDHNLPIAVLFVTIFFVNSAIMWLLLHYATHLKQDYHLAYSVISGFMIAQIITVFATMAKDWPIRFEVASYMPTVFSYIFWRFACLSADAMLGWKQFIRVAVVVVILILVIVLGSAYAPI